MTKSVRDLEQNPRNSQINSVHLQFIDNTMAENDELTAYKLKRILIEKWPELSTVSLTTIRRCRRRLGWISSTPRYCQLIREQNKAKRLEWWCWNCIRSDDHFEDVIFSDKSTVALEMHGKLTFRRLKQPHRLKPRPKHPAKIHIWAAISCRGASSVVLFTRIMNATRYTKILEAGLLPLIQEKFRGVIDFNKTTTLNTPAGSLKISFQRKGLIGLGHHQKAPISTLLRMCGVQ